MPGLLRKILRTGRVTEKARPLHQIPENGTHEPHPYETKADSTSQLGRSLQIRHVDAGSCNGCEIEIAASFGPVYDGERFGFRLVASPRHADALLVTGAVTRNMATALKKTYDATPAPKIVIAMGDCAKGCGAFKDGYGIAGSVNDIVPVDIEIPGCPPEPETIIAALRSIVETSSGTIES